MLQHGAPGEKGRGEASVRAAFRLAAQYIALAQALQPGKDVYRKSLQACRQLCLSSLNKQCCLPSGHLVCMIQGAHSWSLTHCSPADIVLRIQ